MRVLIIHGHPRKHSLTGTLAAAYGEGAREAGCSVAELWLSDMRFDLHVREPSPIDQALEPDLERAWELFTWADHLVFVYPNWWGTMPALLKGFLDRILRPGHAFREVDGHYYGLLHGRTSELITTMDVPPVVYRWVQGAPGPRAMARATLGLCGIETIRFTAFARPSHSDAWARRAWIDRAYGLGNRLADGVRSPSQRFRRAFRQWAAAVRPQFFPMSILAYSAGAMVAGASLSFPAFLIGLVCIVSLKAATVLTNDIYDQDSDARNLRWSPFTGGSRGLHEGGLGLSAYWKGVWIALTLFVLSATGLAAVAPAPATVLAVVIPLGVVALGYTVPPLKLSHRGLGEIGVALTHGPGVVLLGHVAQGGSLADPLPWMLGILIGLAVLPAIILSGLPDRGADLAAGKRTLAVSLGTVGAARLALVFLLLSASAAVAFTIPASPVSFALPWVAVPHALLLSWFLLSYLGVGAPERRIDGLMAGALLYIGWFVIVPVIHLVLGT